MVEVTGLRGGVEDQQPVRETGIGGGDHLGDQARPAHLAQGPIRAVKHLGPGRAEHVGRRGQLSPAQRGEVSGGSLQFPRLAVCQTEHIDPGPAEHERVQDRAETE